MTHVKAVDSVRLLRLVVFTVTMPCNEEELRVAILVMIEKLADGTPRLALFRPKSGFIL